MALIKILTDVYNKTFSPVEMKGILLGGSLCGGSSS